MLISLRENFSRAAILHELVADHIPMFEQKAQHPLVHAERRVHGRQTGVAKGSQTREGQLEIRPVLLQAHECLEVAFQPTTGLRDLVFLRAKEEGVDVHGGAVTATGRPGLSGLTGRGLGQSPAARP